jgi:hypothetical protein
MRYSEHDSPRLLSKALLCDKGTKARSAGLSSSSPFETESPDMEIRDAGEGTHVLTDD